MPPDWVLVIVAEAVEMTVEIIDVCCVDTTVEMTDVCWVEVTDSVETIVEAIAGQCQALQEPGAMPEALTFPAFQ